MRQWKSLTVLRRGLKLDFTSSPAFNRRGLGVGRKQHSARIAIPQEWEWPVGLSLSTEFGYQRRSFTEDTWSWELRPIIDKQWGRWYFSLNPSLEKSIHGRHSNEGYQFAPSAKISFDVTKMAAVGVEYYSSIGTVGRLERWDEQQHQIMPVLDLDFSLIGSSTLE